MKNTVSEFPADSPDEIYSIMYLITKVYFLLLANTYSLIDNRDREIR